jgi:alcohol oxidase
MKYIHPKNGGRSDAPNPYIWPILPSTPNLHVQLETRVSRVLIDLNGRATDVECIHSSAPAVTASNTTTITARKLVILSAGSLSTPQILERSGVGNQSIISAVGITPLVDLPGVGENFQDHHGQLTAYYMAESVAGDMDLLLSDGAAHMGAEKEWQEKGIGPYTTSNIDIAVKYRPREEDIKKLGKDLQRARNKHFAERPDRPVLNFAIGAA